MRNACYKPLHILAHCVFSTKRTPSHHPRRHENQTLVDASDFVGREGLLVDVLLNRVSDSAINSLFNLFSDLLRWVAYAIRAC